MKLITIKYMKKNYDYIEISNVKDLSIYIDKFNAKYELFLKELILSDEPVRRWDHVMAEGENQALFYTSIIESSLKGKSPLIAMSELSNIKNQGMLDMIKRYGSVCIDTLTGSYRPPFDKNDEVIKEVELKLKNK